MIVLNDADPIKFVQKVYELSVTQGTGILAYTPSGLSDDDAKRHITGDRISIDYIGGRSCKMYASISDKTDITFRAPWYDHTDSQLRELCAAFGLTEAVGGNHNGGGCNCFDCQMKRDGIETPV